MKWSLFNFLIFVSLRQKLLQKWKRLLVETSNWVCSQGITAASAPNLSLSTAGAGWARHLSSEDSSRTNSTSLQPVSWKEPTRRRWRVSVILSWSMVTKDQRPQTGWTHSSPWQPYGQGKAQEKMCPLSGWSFLFWHPQFGLYPCPGPFLEQVCIPPGQYIPDYLRFGHFLDDQKCAEQ